MKKKVSHLTALLLTLGAVLCFAAGAAAADTLQTITAYLDAGITVTLNGEVQILTDAKGTRLYPISYNGSTYLPVRAVAGLAGLEVNWDQATKTVQLGTMTGGVDLIDTYKNYHADQDQPWSYTGQVQTADGQTAEISGITCTNWLYYTTKVNVAEVNSISFNLLGKHDTLTFSYYSTKDTVLTVLGDNGSVLGEYNITGGAVAQTVTLPLLKTNELTFQADLQSQTALNIFNAYLDVEE